MDTIRLIDYVDYKDFLPAGFSESTDSSTIPANTYAWNDTYNALRINDASTSLKGSITIPNFIHASVGDVVEFRCEIMNVSGEKGKIALDYENGANIMILQTEKTGEFEQIGGKFIIPQHRKVKAVIGVFTADVGDFYVRNIEIGVKEKATGSVTGFVPDLRAYNFFFSTEGLTLQNGYHPYNCTATVSNTDVLITHGKPFENETYMGTAIANVSAAGVSDLIAKTRSESLTSLRVQFFNSTTGDLVDPTTLYNTSTWFSVVHHGYKV